MIGRMLERYLVDAELGSGGMGVVYRARDTLLDRTVALKVVTGGSGPLQSSRLLSEARASSALSHSNICPIYEIGDPDGQPFIVMEYLEGRRLDEIVAAGGVDPSAVVSYGCQIADALAHAHERGVLHRDIKGANVIVQSNGLLKVLDSG